MTGSAPPVAAAVTPGAGEVEIDRAESVEDITATLARLADLRDQGVISSDDYEEKKQELLGRL